MQDMFTERGYTLNVRSAPWGIYCVQLSPDNGRVDLGAIEVRKEFPHVDGMGRSEFGERSSLGRAHLCTNTQHNTHTHISI